MEPLKSIEIDKTYQIPEPPSRACKSGQGKDQCSQLPRCTVWQHKGKLVQFSEEGPVNEVEKAVAIQFAGVGLNTHGEHVVSQIFKGEPVHVFCAPGDSVILTASET